MNCLASAAAVLSNECFLGNAWRCGADAHDELRRTQELDSAQVTLRRVRGKSQCSLLKVVLEPLKCMQCGSRRAASNARC